MATPSADGRTDPALSDERIDSAPPAIKALFQEFEFFAAAQALQAVGLNDDPALFTDAQIEEGVSEARKILQAEARRRTEDMLRGA